MHQSKKEILTKLWGKKISFDINDNLDKGEFIENTLLLTELDNCPISNNIKKIR